MKITFDTLTSEDEELVFMGCGGELQEWIDGITSDISAKTLVGSAQYVKNLFDGPWVLTTSGGRIDLVFRFKHDNPLLGLICQRLALWRIGFGDCSWISDYKTNYASQHDREWEIGKDSVRKVKRVEVQRTAWRPTWNPGEVILPESIKNLPKIGKKARRKRIVGGAPTRIQPQRSCKK